MVIIIADPPCILDTESCVVADEPRVWGDAREDVEDKFIGQFEDCENGIEQVSVQSRDRRVNSY